MLNEKKNQVPSFIDVACAQNYLYLSISPSLSLALSFSVWIDATESCVNWDKKWIKNEQNKNAKKRRRTRRREVDSFRHFERWNKLLENIGNEHYCNKMITIRCVGAVVASVCIHCSQMDDFISFILDKQISTVDNSNRWEMNFIFSMNAYITEVNERTIIIMHVIRVVQNEILIQFIIFRS